MWGAKSSTIKNSLQKSVLLMYELNVFGWPTATDTSILIIPEKTGRTEPVAIDVDVNGIKHNSAGTASIGNTRVKGFTIVPSGGRISVSLNEISENGSSTNYATELKCIVATLK